MSKAGQLSPKVTSSRDPPSLQETLHELPVAQCEVRQWPLLTRHQLRIVQGAAQDEPRHGIQIRGGDLTTQPHRFQRDRSAAGERIEHLGSATIERLANSVPQLAKLVARLPSPVQHAPHGLFPVAALGLLRDDIAANAPDQFVASTPIARIVQQRRQQDRPTRRKRSPGRPDVQRRDMPVPDVLLVDGIERRLLERKRGLDQTGTHGDLSPSIPRKHDPDRPLAAKPG